MLAAVILAAGAATRFGAPKQALLLPTVLERVRGSEASEIVVVVGAHEVDVDARVVRCPDWVRGPGASLRCGLAAVSDAVDEVVVVLADGPELSTEAIARVAAARRGAGAELAAASYGGVRGHPLVLARSGWTGIPDEGLRSRVPLLVPCDDLGAPGDVDIPAELPEGFRSAPAEPM